MIRTPPQKEGKSNKNITSEKTSADACHNQIYVEYVADDSK